MCAIVPCSALVDGLEVDGVLQRAVFNKISLGDTAVVAGQAHDEPEVDLGVRVQLASAKLDDIAHAFGWAVFAVDTFVPSGTI